MLPPWPVEPRSVDLFEGLASPPMAQPTASASPDHSGSAPDAPPIQSVSPVGGLHLVHYLDDPTRQGEISPAPQETTAAVDWLCGVYGSGDGAPWVRWGMVASANGSVAGPDGKSGSLGTLADQLAFTALRAVADVIVVGAGTARTENYGPVQPPPGAGTPAALVVLTRTGDLPPRLLDDAAVWAACPPDRYSCVANRLGACRVISTTGPGDLVAQLNARGFWQVLCEGGPSVWARWASVCHELCATIAPTLVGPGAFWPSFAQDSLSCAGATSGWPTPGDNVGADQLPTSQGLMRPLQLASLIVHQDTILARWRCQ